jgi:hypothetical protein
MAKKVNEIKTIDDGIVAVRLGGRCGPTIYNWSYSIVPHAQSDDIAPMFFWSKAFDHRKH